MSFSGVPFAEFCERDRPRVESVVATPGMVGVAGLCDACKAKIDAANPSAPEPEHPTPWRWDGICLMDADGNIVLELAEGFGCIRGTPRVRALTEVAPEMLALLREAFERAEAKMKRDAAGGLWVEESSWMTATRALLARLPKEGGG